MELRVLRYFLAVAQEENISKAAENLHLTQPTLSRQIAGLEEELGVRLFDREKHRLRLTQDGFMFKRRAQELVDLENKTKAQFLSTGQDLAGEISFGCGELLSMTETASYIKEFSLQHKNISYRIFSGNTDAIIEQLEKGILDFALLLEPADLSSYGFFRMRTKEVWKIFVPVGSPLSKKTFICPKDLDGIPLITTSRTNIRKYLENWLGSTGTELHIAATVNLPYNLAMLVRQGLGAGLCLDLECRYREVTSVPFRPPMELTSVLAWKKNVPQSREAEAFIRFLRKKQEPEKK